MVEMPTESEPVQVIEGDCLEVMAGLPDSSVDLVLTDPPYGRFKDDGWDRQWKTDAEYLEWLGKIRDQWYRLLKPNGSLYCFASPRMAARVELAIGERFNVLNRIVWNKDGGWSGRQRKEEQRMYFPHSERIVFAEHYGADNIAKGEAGYAAKCDELRGFVFESLRAYFAEEKKRCGISTEQIMDGMEARGVGRYMFARHTFTRSQWQLPTQEQYEAARDLFNSHGKDEYLRREYEELRREYEELRREYEELRRPFSVTADVPYTDVWEFKTVQRYKGKHPCEKPLNLLRHIVRASSRPGAVVLDSFGGSGSTGKAAALEGRRAILVERDPKYAAMCRRSAADAMGSGLLAGLT